MSMAIGHFAIGVSSTMGMYYMLPLRVRIKLKVAQVFIILLGGLWAMLPDINNFTGIMHYFNEKYWTRIVLFQGTVLSDLTRIIDRISTFHNSNWSNICFFHHLMDVVDKNDSPLISGIFVFLMASVVAALLVKELFEKRSIKQQ